MRMKSLKSNLLLVSFALSILACGEKTTTFDSRREGSKKAQSDEPLKELVAKPFLAKSFVLLMSPPNLKEPVMLVPKENKVIIASANAKSYLLSDPRQIVSQIENPPTYSGSLFYLDETHAWQMKERQVCYGEPNKEVVGASWEAFAKQKCLDLPTEFRLVGMSLDAAYGLTKSGDFFKLTGDASGIKKADIVLPEQLKISPELVLATGFDANSNRQWIYTFAGLFWRSTDSNEWKQQLISFSLPYQFKATSALLPLAFSETGELSFPARLLAADGSGLYEAPK